MQNSAIAKAVPSRQKWTDKPGQGGAVSRMYQARPPTGRGQVGGPSHRKWVREIQPMRTPTTHMGRARCESKKTCVQRRYPRPLITLASIRHGVGVGAGGHTGSSRARWVDSGRGHAPLESKCRESQGREARVPTLKRQPRGLPLNDTPVQGCCPL